MILGRWWYSSSALCGDLCRSIPRQCVVYFLCSRFLSEVVLNNITSMVSNTDSQRREWTRSGRHSRGCLCERVLMWHPGTLSKGHVDVVTGEWVAVASICVCVHVCICASMEEAAMKMREMTWWQDVLLVVLEGWEIEAPVMRNQMPVTHGGVVMAVEVGGRG